MSSPVKLYDVFGELLYALAMADGVIQPEEVAKMEQVLEKHPWGKEIQWSFHFEAKQHSDVEEVYQKVISFCQHHGPDPVYAEMISAMEEVAAASDGIDADEREMMENFSKALLERFRADIEKLHRGD